MTHILITGFSEGEIVEMVAPKKHLVLINNAEEDYYGVKCFGCEMEIKSKTYYSILTHLQTYNGDC